jgi:glycosyltransferase involved in cell wall biosynthesis
MIRVAQLIQSADTHAGGTTTAFFNILAAAGTFPEELKLDAYFLRPPEGDPAWKRIEKNAGMFHLAPTAGKMLFPKELGKLVAADLAAGKIDVLHVHGVWSPELIVATRAARRAGVPYVWQSHGMLLAWALNYKRLKKKLFLMSGLQKCLDNSSSYIMMTKDEVENTVYPARITRERRHLVPLPVEMPDGNPRRAELAARGRERFGLGSDTKVLAFMGRLHPVKRVDMTISAFALAVKERPEMRLLLLGKGETEEYEAQVKRQAVDMGVADKVVFAGWVLGDDKTAGLCAATALVLNSVIESFGYVLFEAIGVGTPALITENLALARDFKEADAAFIAPNTVEGLAREMVRVVDDADAPACAERARAWARREFSYRAVGEKLVGVYRQAAADRRS